MGCRHALFFALLLAAALHCAQGRLLKSASPPTIPATASRQNLPSSALSDPSPLLNAPPTGGWQPVPGAQPVTADGAQGSPDMRPRIIDGNIDDQAALFPYAAFIQWRINETAAARCSGSLVGPSHVLTAAHCLSSEQHTAEPSQLRIWIRGEWFTAAAAYPHEGYNQMDGSPSRPSNDVGLIALASPSSVAPVRLPEGPADRQSGAATRQLAVPLPTAGTKVWAAGFGITEEGEASDVLRYTDLTVLESSECPPAFADDFCAGGQSGFTCQGDSGGPIVLSRPSGDEVVGVTSWGPADCRTPYSFYTRVADHLPWIKAKMALPVTVGGSGSGSDSGSGSGSGGLDPVATKPGLSDAVADWLGKLPASR